jgi:glycosyltransferase involved in cell wall biosynthesis
VPVEAQACGTPVVALARGGSLDTVVDGVTGVLIPEQSADLFAEGLKTVLDGSFRAEDSVANARRFSQAQFRTRFRDWVLHAASGNGS